MRDHFTTGEPSTVDRPLSAVSDASPKSTSSHHPVPSNSSFTSHKMMSWIMPSKSKSTSTDAKSIQKESPELRPSLAVDVDVDMTRLYELSIKDLPDYTKSIRLNIAPMASKVILEPLENGTAAPSPTSAAREQTPISSPKTVDKESKSKVPTSVLPWKTKWKPSPEDKKNWNRFLSTNSEEMSKTMQFSFNDLKLRGFAGHTGTVRTMTVNEPAKIFASGSRDRTVKLWSLNVHDGIEHWATRPFSESLVTYTGHRRGAINDVHFLSGGGSNGLSNIVASCDGHIHLWEPETGKAIHQFNIGRASIVSVKPIFHSRCLVAGALEGHITFFDTHNHRALHTWKSSLNTTGTVRAITVNQAETLIAVGYSTGVISLLESRTGTLVASWKGGDTEITMVKFYTDELVMTCAPADHLICCWNVHRLALVKTIPISQDVVSLDIFKDEILTINGNNSVSFIPINDDFQSYSSKFKSSIIKSQVSSLAIVPTDQLLLFGCTEGEIFLYA
ncbi:WD40-repeat-containing domain protein [Radiomyces spectabilis]|uniref:WD40-repeat-containing domain protein n=1 Tax=Radiomyces spectabilis TaxID=64574 RepID=UPI0022200919|nr:WD40-repeat-containing domain protein [Radiomyces spectabilis]KAI8381047.1 WD40-repeat-containing domain protein [Radiomyces spectabilis]